MKTRGVIGLSVAALLAFSMPARANDLAPETAHVETLPDGSRDHWVALGDLNPLGSLDTRVVLFDADKGTMLGQLNTGYWSGLSYFPRDTKNIVTLETYFEKGTRGPRKDYVVIYDGKTLLPLHEINIPPRRMTALTQTQMAGLSDDGRFMAVSNFTPAQTLTLVDLQEHRFLTELETPGCGQVYPLGPRSFALLCGDAALRVVTLSDEGVVISQDEGEPFFDPFKDPVLVPAARYGATWLFVSMGGIVHEVGLSEGKTKLTGTWSLLTDSERDKKWRTGGVQPLAVHEATGELFVLMRQGGAETYEEPAETVWVYDIKTHKKLRTIALENATMAINVSRDAAPLLNAASLKLIVPYWSLALVSMLGHKFADLDVVKPALDVYDAASGHHLRTIDHAANFGTSVTQP
ncbi:MAG: amine dehydrogenase large subunit [Parvibaculaceae bacterium]